MRTKCMVKNYKDVGCDFTLGSKNLNDFNRTYRNFTMIWIRKVEVSVRDWHNGVENIYAFSRRSTRG